MVVKDISLNTLMEAYENRQDKYKALLNAGMDKAAEGYLNAVETESNPPSELMFLPATSWRYQPFRSPADKDDADEIEIIYNLPKEDGDKLMREVLVLLKQIDTMIPSDSGSPYYIFYFDVYCNKIKIGYASTQFNDNFDMVVQKNDDQWFLCQIGLGEFGILDPPIPI